MEKTNRREFLARVALSAGAAGDKGKWPAGRIEGKSTLDGTLQPAWFWAPEKAKTEELVSETTAAAIAALDRLPGDTAFLRDLAQKLVGRTV